MLGPTFAEMKDPTRIDPTTLETLRTARTTDPLDPINLFDIRWKDDGGRVPYWRVPDSITGTDATVVLLLGDRFPTGAHKVGAAYSCLIEDQLFGLIDPAEHTLVFPSTGNYGIGGAWVGPRMGYKSLVVLPEEMSEERFERIRAYGADIVATPGSESNVKEIYDEVKRLQKNPEMRILNQFAAWGNYRFHRHVTADAARWVARDLGFDRVGAFVSAMGSAGTIAAGDDLKKTDGTVIVGLEPQQCPTLFNCGFGAHRIEGIGDKHVTWIHNVGNMDYLAVVDDQDSLEALQLLQEGSAVLQSEAGLSDADLAAFQGHCGVSAMCNLLGALATARQSNLGKGDLIVTLATDSFDRYPSVLRKLTASEGPQTNEVAQRRLAALQEGGQRPPWWLEGTPDVRKRWHNQKYFTWVEQQGKTAADLRQIEDPGFYDQQAARVEEIDSRLERARG